MRGSAVSVGVGFGLCALSSLFHYGSHFGAGVAAKHLNYCRQCCSGCRYCYLRVQTSTHTPFRRPWILAGVKTFEHMATNGTTADCLQRVKCIFDDNFFIHFRKKNTAVQEKTVNFPPSVWLERHSRRFWCPQRSASRTTLKWLLRLFGCGTWIQVGYHQEKSRATAAMKSGKFVNCDPCV